MFKTQPIVALGTLPIREVLRIPSAEQRVNLESYVTLYKTRERDVLFYFEFPEQILHDLNKKINGNYVDLISSVENLREVIEFSLLSTAVSSYLEPGDTKPRTRFNFTDDEPLIKGYEIAFNMEYDNQPSEIKCTVDSIEADRFPDMKITVYDIDIYKKQQV